MPDNPWPPGISEAFKLSLVASLGEEFSQALGGLPVLLVGLDEALQPDRITALPQQVDQVLGGILITGVSKTL